MNPITNRLMNAPDTLGWSDQPSVCDNATLLLRFFAERAGVSIELRERRHLSRLARGHCFLVTAGNLFGSQTVVCPTIRKALALIQRIVDNEKGSRAIGIDPSPHGELLPNRNEEQRADAAS